MRPEKLTVRLRRRPIVPIRIHITDGMTNDIRHPENLMVLRARMDIGVGGDPAKGVIDRVDYVPLLHVVRTKDLPAVVSPSGNGQTS